MMLYIRIFFVSQVYKINYQENVFCFFLSIFKHLPFHCTPHCIYSYIPNCNRCRVYCFRSRYCRFYKYQYLLLQVYLYTTITQCIIIIQVRCINSNIFNIYIYEFSTIILISHRYILHVIKRNFTKIFCCFFHPKN